MAILYIIFSFYAGSILCQKVLFFVEDKLSAQHLPWFRLSASLPLGLIATTSWVYFNYYLFQTFERPLLYANLTLLLPLILMFEVSPLKWSKESCFYTQKFYPETAMFFFLLLISSYLCFHSIYFANQHMVIGASVQSDFGPHTAMIRSFSLGKNIPTNYPLFPGDGVRYHFMFYFLIGNLEYLGLNLPWALNIASIFTFCSSFLLFFLFIRLITDNILVAWLTIIFFLFRSSPAFPYKIYQIIKSKEFIKPLFTSPEFISLTENEHWGIWGINVWANQRHLPTGFAILMIILIAIWTNYLPKKANN